LFIQGRIINGAKIILSGMTTIILTGWTEMNVVQPAMLLDAVLWGVGNPRAPEWTHRRKLKT